MLVIGVILSLIALVVVGFMAFGTANLEKIEIDLWVLTANLNPLEIFGLGALSIVVLAVGLVLIFAGLRRQRRKSKELQELRHRAQQADRTSPRDESGAAGRTSRSGHGSRDVGRETSGTGTSDPSDDRVVRGGDPAKGTAEGRDGRIDIPMDHRQPRADGEGR